MNINKEKILNTGVEDYNNGNGEQEGFNNRLEQVEERISGLDSKTDGIIQSEGQKEK